MSKGTLVILSGFSGVGKGTAMNELVKRYGYALSISATTREPRPGDVDGVNYFFKTREEFEKLIAEDGFLEYAEYNGNYYGTPKAYVEEQLAQGKVVFLEIEVQGAMKVKEKRPDAVMLFISAPDADTLRARLTARGTETPEQIEKRLKAAVTESESMPFYEYIVCNEEGKLDACVETIHDIVESTAFLRNRQVDFILQMQRDLKEHL